MESAAESLAGTESDASVCAIILTGRRPEVDRLDLTYMDAFAIDDEGNQDPDDALGFHDGKLWVHIADSSWLIPAGTEADKEARGRAANLYLPETTIPMLPPEATANWDWGFRMSHRPSASAIPWMLKAALWTAPSVFPGSK